MNLRGFLFWLKMQKRQREAGYLWPVRCTYGKDNIRTVVLHSAGQDQQKRRSSRVYASDNQRRTCWHLDQTLHRAARLELGKRKSQRKKPRRKGFEPVILNRYLGKEQSDRHTLMEVFRAHNEKCRALSGISLAPGTVIRYETSLRLTEEFLQKNYQKEDCYLDEVTNQFIEDFEFFLKTVRRCCPLQRREGQPRAGRGALLESDARSVRYRRPHEPRAVHGQL